MIPEQWRSLLFPSGQAEATPATAGKRACKKCVLLHLFQMGFLLARHQ